MKKTLLLSGITLLLSLNANAQLYNSCNCQQHKNNLSIKSSSQNKTTHSRISPVIGADIVYSVMNFSDNSELIKNYAEDEYVAFSVSLGAKLNPYFGIEGFYQQSEEGESNKYHKINISGLGEGNLKTSYTAYGVDLVGYIPTDIQHVNLLGSIGIGQYEFEGKIKNNYTSVSDNDDGIGIRLGIGLQSNISENIALRFMGKYSHLNTDYIDNMFDLTAGLRFYF